MSRKTQRILEDAIRGSIDFEADNFSVKFEADEMTKSQLLVSVKGVLDSN